MSKYRGIISTVTRGIGMKHIIWMIAFIWLFMIPVGMAIAADPPKPASTPQFDEMTKDFFKKHRNLNSDLVQAHEDLYRYSNPDNFAKGLNLDDILNQEGVARQAKKDHEALEIKKMKTEQKIRDIQKSIDTLYQDLIAYYKGKLPSYVSDSWKTEDDYTAYRISKIK